MKQGRVFLLVCDSVGIGGAEDAAKFGDEGANTLGHIIEARRKAGGIALPNLAKLGLSNALKIASGFDAPELDAELIGFSGAAAEHSNGKDTPSGHWEIAGLPVPWDWHYFPNEDPAFPEELLAKIKAKTGVEFIGNKHASGTAVIEELGAEHLATGKPIAYTSTDSVFQIAAHEEAFGLERLYQLCEDVAEIVHPMMVGRVIARPFIGEIGSFRRTSNRHDYAITPPSPTMLNHLQNAGHKVIGIGKIRDIFAGSGIDESHSGKPDDALFDDLLEMQRIAPDGALVFANFVEFDSEYGHRRDVEGYARHLEWFDRRLDELLQEWQENDLLIITADHGNDPTWQGTDHTRERVPVLCFSPKFEVRSIGLVNFADIGATVLDYFQRKEQLAGKSFLPEDK